ncbi:MAG: PAS domain S-box protein [Cyanobacteria bacterium P01_G01_bin.19]
MSPTQKRSHPSKLPRQLRLASIIICIIVIALGSSVIVGWLLDITWLKSVIADRVTMKVSTALGTILGGITLLLWHQQQHKRSLIGSIGLYLLPSIAIAFSFITLIEYGFNLDLGTSWLTVPDSPDAVDAVVQGKMSPLTAWGFLLLNMAILFLVREYYLTAQLLTIGILAIAVASLIGHLYNVRLLYSVGSSTGVAIHTAIGFLLLSGALLATRSERGWMRVLTKKEAGGLMARWLLPLTIFVPPLLGGLIWWQVADIPQASGLAIALTNALEMLILSFLVWWMARKLNQSDRQRQQLYVNLLEAETRFRAIVEDQTELICRYRADSTISFVNEAYCRYFGVKKEQLIDRVFTPLIYDGDRELVTQKINSMSQTNPTVTITHRVWVNGKVRWNQWNNRIILNETGGISEYQAVGRDITTIKSIETKLRESETRFRLAFEDAATGEALVSPDGRFIKVNQSLCEIVGCSEAELLQKTFQEITHPDDLDLDLNYIRQMLAGEIRTYQMEKRYFHASGYWIWILLSVSLVKDLEDKPLYFIAQIQDINQRKQAEAKLNGLLQELARSNQELEEFASVVSHDLISPLRRQNLFIESLQEDYGAVLDEEGKEYLTRMTGLNSRMKALINNLLTYARITTRSQPFASVSLKDVVEDVIYDLEPEISRLHAQIEVVELPTVTGDRSQLQQLFQNLLQNALKFHASDRPPEIRISQVLTNTDFYQINITDNGIGFEPEQQEKIFTPFHRLYSQSKYAGTGLGLAICDKIVQRHQGKIVARSQSDRGATFTVYLPKENNYFNDPEIA